MNTQWRLFVTALRRLARAKMPARLGGTPVPASTSARYMPLIGALIGAVGGGVYWAGAQIWPTSVAVVLSLLATTLLAAERVGDPPSTVRDARPGVTSFVFAILIKYNALMALSAANLPFFPLPSNIALGLIMIAGHAASRAMAVSLIAQPGPAASKPVSNGDLVFALAVGFAPAMLMGLPGLVGLASAIVARIALGAYLKRKRASIGAAELNAAQQLTETCFYLGSLGAWTYV